MKRFLYILITVAGLSLLASPVTDLPMDKVVWARIDSLESQGLYRSALKLADQVYHEASRRLDPQEEIRALIYRLKYTQELEEDGQEAAISLLSGTLPDNRMVPGALKQTMLAELYYRYYSANRWQLSQNPPEDGNSDRPMKNWSPERFYRVILAAYGQSLGNPDQLAGVRVSSLPELWTGSLADTVNRPALYDMLIGRAIEFIRNAPAEFSLPALRPVQLCTPEMFAEPGAFYQAVQRTAVSENPFDKAIFWYGEWLHRTRGDALVAADLQRLHFVLDHSCHASRDSLYQGALLGWKDRLGKDSSAAMVFEALAQYRLDRAGLYQINDPDTLKYRNDRTLAREWLNRSQEWPSTNAARRCLNTLKMLRNPELTALAEPCQVPGTAFPVSLEYRNIADLFYRVVRMPAMTFYTSWNELPMEARIERVNRSAPVRTGTVRLPDDGMMNPHRIQMIMDPLPPGFYLLVLSLQKDILPAGTLVTSVPLPVSRTIYLTGDAGTGKREFWFRDRDSGAPLSGLSVVPWYTLYDSDARRQVTEKGSRRNAGLNGYLELADGGPGRLDPNPKAYRLEITGNGDTLVTQEMFYPGYVHGKAVKRTAASLYTDRSLYKPGEKAFFRGVLVDFTGDSMSPHKRDSIKITLQDPRYQSVAELMLPVDYMGVFHGSFPLPAKGLTGQYILQTAYGQAVVQMEQYRRPAFAVEILPGKEIWHPGDSLLLRGRVTALSGEPVAGAEVIASIDLQPVGGRMRWMPFSDRKIRIMELKLTTSADGLFVCRWKSISEASNPFGSGIGMRYGVQLTVTDLNGESHQEESFLDCGKETVSLTLGLPARIEEGDTLTGSCQASSSDGRIVSLPVNLKISKLTEPLRFFSKPLLPVPDRFLVSRKEWEKRVSTLPYRDEHLPESWPESAAVVASYYANDTLSVLALNPHGGWNPGWYKAELSAADAKAAKSVVRYFRVEDPSPSRIGEAQALMTHGTKGELKPGEKVELLYGSGRKGFLLVDLRNRKGVVGSGWYASDRKPAGLSWKVTEAWQGGALMHLYVVRSNRIYEETIAFDVPWQKSALSVTGLERIGTIKPGDSVKLQLRILDTEGNPVRASMGITVYDASLDRIKMHAWPVIARRSWYGGALAFTGPGQFANGSFNLADPVLGLVDIPEPEPLGLNWFGLGFYGISQMNGSMVKMAMARSDAAPGGLQEPEGAVVYFRGDAAGDTGKDNQSAIPVKKAEKPDGGIVIRSDFRETAYWAGNITTDLSGAASIGFRVPDAFTEWKVMVTALDGSLATGYIDKTFRSAKELMIRPNFPEFIRKGDSLDLAARLGWYGKGRVETETSLSLIDSIGNRMFEYPSVRSELASGSVVPFYWSFKADKRVPVTWILKSDASVSSDGISDTIRVLPDDVRLWEARPFFFARPGKKVLKVGPNPEEAYFEVTTTPVWQVLQSLPVVSGKERDCSEYWFSRLYLASLTGGIADRFPAVAAQFLKDSVPADRKAWFRQIGEWMNPHSRVVEVSYVMEKLSDLQNPDGSWPWFRGMGTDLFMTQQLIAGFGELKSYGVFDVTATQRGNYMLNQAVEAMDTWLYRQFREVIRQDSLHPMKVHLNPLIIHYLYARSFYPGLAMAPENEIAWLHFRDRIPLEWTQQEPGLQALLAIASIRLGREGDALPIYRSLRERAKTDEQWGIFWPRKGSSSGWFNWDIWMQSRMTELFASLEEGSKELDQVRLYLIHQKRGRDWGNGMVAAWACKSLLFYGKIENQPASVGFTWGSEEFSPLRIKTGSRGVTGYYRFNWKNREEIPAAPVAEVRMTEGGPAWGTLFTLSNYRIDDLSASEGPLSIKRELLVLTKQGSWSLIAAGNVLRVGDVLRIRLTIRSDRELSYIQVKDQLSAGLMPLQVLSGYQYHTGLSWYQSREPEAVVCYVSQLPKGESTIEYQAVVEQAGNYSGGYAEAVSLYAPEFRAWSGSSRIRAGR